MDPVDRWTALLSMALAQDPAAPSGANHRRAQSVLRNLIDDELIDVMWDAVVKGCPEAELVLIVLRRVRSSRVFERALPSVCSGPESDLASAWDLLRASVTAADIDALDRAFATAPVDRHVRLAGAFIELLRDDTTMLTTDEVERIRVRLVSSPSPSVRAAVEGALGPTFLNGGAARDGESS